MKMVLRGVLGVVFLLVTAFCASKAAAPPPSGEGLDSKTRAEAFEAAVKDLSEKIGAPKSDVAGVSQEDVTWPDSCLGCAKTGEMCAQVLTPGYKLTLRVRDATYVYHSNRGDRVRLCDQSSLSPVPTPTPVY
ncbi:MAG: hypothetical protein ABR576_00095 [Thermoanaerobaculia bacterium]